MSFLLKDQVYEKLLGLLNEGKLEPGKTYSLNALAADLNMSRTPVRDAIMKLADERRLDLLPSRGVRLHQMTEEEMHQHYHFSTAIEGYCAACLAKAYEENPNNIYVRQMEKDLEGMVELAGEEGDFSSFFALDQDFHRKLLESLEDDYFRSLQYSPMGFFGHPELQRSPEKLPRKSVCQCHENILNAVREGNPVEAYQAVMEHAKLMYQGL